uniref:Uncharacterized protein n=1 Tax=Populus trichocarpa TaxID=3694 RepID=A0A3N7FY80_POPTR
MSKNAQFRAIQPSPSILSYVEENFLGRRRLIELKRAGYNADLSAPLDNIPFSTSSERERIEENSLKANRSLVQPVMMVSSKSGAGLRGLRTVLSKVARFAKL